MIRLRVWLIDRGGLVAIAALALYVCLAPAHVVDGDNAELSTLSVTGGIAHPSGYPLYLLWLHAMAWLPGASSAQTAAVATAILGGAAVAMLHAACRAWGTRPVAASLACAVFATAPVVMRVASEAEVFILNALLVSAVLWLAAISGPARGRLRAGGLGLVAGLALANHLTCVLVAPIGILGVVRAAREGDRVLVTLAVAAGGLAVGLLPYLYAFAAADTPASWGAIRDLGALVAHASRRDYGTTRLVAHGDTVALTASIGSLLATIARSWLYVPVLAGAAVLALRIARPIDGGETRWGWALLALSWLLAGPVFVSRFDTAPEGIGLYISQRFHVLPVMLATIPIAAAIDLARIPPRFAPGALLVFALCAALSIPRVARLHTAALERFAHNTLTTLPDHAVVIVGTDAFYYAMLYRQWARDERRDVTVVAWPMMAVGWYRDRVAARGVVGDPGAGPPEVLLANHLLATGRPLFVEPGETALGRAFPTYPSGTLARVVARGDEVPAIDDVVEMNRELYQRFDLDYERPGRDDEWATLVHQRYAAPWRAIADVLAAQGRAPDAGAALDVARAIGPTP